MFPTGSVLVVGTYVVCSLGHRELQCFVKYPMPDFLVQGLGSHSRSKGSLEVAGSGGAGIREITCEDQRDCLWKLLGAREG